MSFEPQEISDAWNLVNKALANGNGKDQQRIAEVGLCVVGMLLMKNAAYGSSAFEPIRVFAKGLTALDQIYVRLDDKLSRVALGSDFGDEDVLLDIAGYCVLGLIARERQ